MGEANTIESKQAIGCPNPDIAVCCLGNRLGGAIEATLANAPNLVSILRNPGRWVQRMCRATTGQKEAQGYELSSQP
ncbi:hypothetical protein [Granulicella mallensis]|uniref:Uncharacterized protein n=1 Tax=Granulicella mallensis TaxID=940614 RepID=A0A7W7ZUB6_9BACT|nr:hypothetical protein [Granulicella mallensis]MBB5066263.1 hypothetical protein [Granulicella mallensis]